MKKIDITAYGAPEEVAHCIDALAVGEPGPDEVVFDVLAFPINPADISFCRGSYRLRPSLPATPGAEGLGRVIVVGADVTHVKTGDLVINMQRENWAQRRRVKAEDAVPIPPGLDLAQAAMLRINPPTALLLLEDHVALKPGEWVIQNVANSAVGRQVIVLANARSVRTVNVVRRDDVAGELRDLGADAVVKDSPDLAARAGSHGRSADQVRHRRRLRGGLQADRRLRRRGWRRCELWVDVRPGPGDEPRGGQHARRQSDRVQSRPRHCQAHT